LNAKLEVANKSSSCIDHVVICNRCKDFNIDACVEHLTSIAKLNGEVASLNAQLKTSKNDFDKLKFARDAYTIGRHPSINDGLGFKREAKNLTSQRAPFSTRKKGRLLWLIVVKRIMHLFMIENILEMFTMIGVVMLMIQMTCLLQVLPLCIVEICLGEMLFMYLENQVMNLLQFIMLAMLLLQFVGRIRK
jgi:hypothetical protein